MDEQRSKKVGKPNYWVVLTVDSPEILRNLALVHSHLEEKYRHCRAELRAALTSLSLEPLDDVPDADLDRTDGVADESDGNLANETNNTNDSASVPAKTPTASTQLHVTLFAIHCTNQRLKQVKRVFHAFPQSMNDKGHDLSFEMELKGLGAWQTQSGNIVLYADFSKDSAQSIKRIAKYVRDYLFNEMAKQELAKKGVSVDELENFEVNGEANNESNLESEDTENLPAFETNDGNSEESEKEDGSLEQYIESLHSPSPIPREKTSASKKVQPTNEKLKAHFPIFENDEGYDFEGIWMDDPYEGIFIPHLTLMNSDARTDKVLRDHILESVTTKSKKSEKREKRGGTGKGGKGTNRSKSRNNNGKSSDEEECHSSSNFGWNYNLMRDTRREFAKFVFGRQEVRFVELQGGFRCIQRIDISGAVPEKAAKNNRNNAKGGGKKNAGK